MTDRLTINIVSPGYTAKPTGGLRVVFEYADFLAARGHAVILTFPWRISPARHALDTLRGRLWALKMRATKQPLFPWHQLHPQVRVELIPDLNAASMPDADVVVATMWSTAAPVAALPPAKGRKYYLIQGYEIWGGPENQVHATWRLPLRKIVISKWLEEIGRGLGASDMRHIPNGMDLEHFHITNPPERRPMHVLTLNHKGPLKGVEDALAVLTSYHERFPTIPISMVGVPPRAEQIPPWISYLHNPPQKNLVEDFYNCGTIYLSASVSEGWPLPPAEAMACGCVFVGADSGGVRDYAIHNDTALISPPRDRAALLRNLIAVTEDRALWQGLQQRSHENIQQFTWERAGSALERYLLE